VLIGQGDGCELFRIKVFEVKRQGEADYPPEIFASSVP
jgi:hypothetical protein